MKRGRVVGFMGRTNDQSRRELVKKMKRPRSYGKRKNNPDKLCPGTFLLCSLPGNPARVDDNKQAAQSHRAGGEDRFKDA